jgi:16S rRNA (adenine1518-N6/adenine1519-N6)-dimethyltransferase
VEIDRDLALKLKKNYLPERLIVHESDALAFDFGALAKNKKLKVVGNLPYNISTPILFHLLTFAEQIIDMHFMLQKEVVDRMVAHPNGAAYGRLSVMLQSRFYLESLLDVPPEAFEPVPKVHSAVVRLIPKPLSELTVVDPDCFARLVSAAFGQRRKMLRNTLKPWFSEASLLDLGISPTARAEELSPEDFARLGNALKGEAA